MSPLYTFLQRLLIYVYTEAIYLEPLASRKCNSQSLCKQLCSAVTFSTVQSSRVHWFQWCNAELYIAMKFSAVQCSTELCSAVKFCAVHCTIVRQFISV